MTDQTPIDPQAGTAVALAPAQPPAPKPQLETGGKVCPIVPRTIEPRMTDQTPIDPQAGTAVALAPAQPPAPKPQLETGGKVCPIVPRTIEEVARVANAVITAGLAPDSYKGGTPQETASRVIVGIMKGAEVGFPPITALSTIAIINGRPCIYGDGAVALAQSHGLIEKFEHHYDGDEEGEDYACHVRIWRKGQESPYEGHFSVKDAKRARLLGKPGPWTQYMKRMLFNRARAFPLRDGFADCLCGLAIAEEVRDLPEAPKPVDLSVLDDDLPALPTDETPKVAAE
jgi:hypothetical protein